MVTPTDPLVELFVWSVLIAVGLGVVAWAVTFLGRRVWAWVRFILEDIAR